MIRQLFRLLDPEHHARFRRYLIALVAYAVLQGAAVTLTVPVLRPLLRGDTDEALPWLGAMTAVVAVSCAAYYTQAMLGFRSALALQRGLHRRVGDHVSALPLGWFTTERVGRLAQSTSQGTVMITSVPAHLLAPLVISVVTPVTVAAGMLFFDWRLALSTVVLAPLLAAVYRWSNKLVARSAHGVDAAGVESASRVVEFAQTQPVLRAFGRTTDGHRLLDDALAEQRRASNTLLRSGVPGAVGFALAVQAALTVVLVVGATLALDGSVDAAELIALLVLATRFTGPLIEVADFGAALRLAAHDIDRIDEILAVRPLPEPDNPVVPDDALRGTGIDLAGVDFGYGDEQVLHDVSFAVPANTTTALVGPSGSGKTTITRLIARFWDADAGQVKVGGVDVRSMTTEELMSRLSLVFQDVHLFDDTIEGNIRIGRPDATDAEVREAARLARVDEIVERLPAGWETRVGERGAALSGGERQRVSIARALLKSAPIVLLDEATAALDPENEAAVHDALRALAADRTLIVIAHRLGTVMSADNIVVLDQGRVVQQGTHAQLVTQPGRYATFWHERERAQGWRLAAKANTGDTPSP